MFSKPQHKYTLKKSTIYVFEFLDFKTAMLNFSLGMYPCVGLENEMGRNIFGE